MGGVRPSYFGTPEKPSDSDPAVKDKYWAGYSSSDAFFGKDKAASRAYFDDTDSDAFKARLYGDLSAIGSRGAPQAKTTSLGAGATPSAAKVGAMSTYGGATMGRADLAVRADQAAMLARLGGIADGTTMGAGQQQVGASLASAQAANTAAAGSGSARFGGGSALRALGNRQGADAQAAAGMGAAAKVGDQQQAGALYGALAGAMRSTDAGAAEQQADLYQKAGMFSAGALNTSGLAQAGFDQQSGMFRAQAAAKQADMDFSVQMANMEATLRSQGLDEAAIAARIGFLQDQNNRDKSDRMRFWDYASGGQKWDASRAYGLDAAATLKTNQQLAAAGGFGATMAGAWGGGGSGGGSGGGWSGDMSGASKSADGYSYGDAETAGKLGGG